MPNEDVTVRRYEIMQRFIEGVRNLELKRNLALMYAQEQYVETPPTVEALRFTVQQYLRMRGPTRSENYPAPQQQLQNPVLVNPQNPTPAAAAPVPNAQNLHNSQWLIDNNRPERALIAVTHHTLLRTAL